MRIQWNAVAADAGARIEGHEAEGLGRRRLDHRPPELRPLRRRHHDVGGLVQVGRVLRERDEPDVVGQAELGSFRVHQIDETIELCRQRVEKGERILVTTLTKRTAEDLADYLRDVGLKVRYLHSDIDAIERVEILRGLRAADFDILVGINLLREGLDLPEVSLVCILDADKEGFLRSSGSLIQTMGRAARNVNGRVIMYADRVTASMRAAIDETERRTWFLFEASRDAGLLVVGLSTRWHREGLGPARLRLARDATSPTLLVRRGLRPGGLAPPAALTRFTWSIRP